MTPEQELIYNVQLKRLGKIIQKRIEDEIQKAKFLDVYPTTGEMERFNYLENTYKALGEQLDRRDLNLGLQNVIVELRDIEIELQKYRFDKEQLDTKVDYYELVLADYLSEVNNRFPEDTIPHLPPWESKQLPDAGGPVGGNKKKTKKLNKKSNKKSNKRTRKH